MTGKNKRIGPVLLFIGAVLVAAQYTGILPALAGENDRLAIFLLGLGMIILGIRYLSSAIEQPVKIEMAPAGAEMAPSFLNELFSNKELLKNVLSAFIIVVYIVTLAFGGLFGIANVPALKELAMMSFGYLFGKAA